MMSEAKAKILIESLKPLQNERKHFPCPGAVMTAWIAKTP